ncbi:KilA-N domain-containing protein [Chitinophaga sp. CF118]|uniref:KilA-N domain-containing protein n=1 Tax=Chitinophaga sp. CF118 TaxID=1884367 RepID=UPI0008E449CA|nr:KilA-N domain-containing protein [Chitinophaga sp. CF118]SFE03688.1 KilA-N domain-containing protein [Chitinophaga sp. CF118]
MMAKKREITVQDKIISVIDHHDVDYISLTDMVRQMPSSNIVIGNWLRKKDTIEYLGLWEQLYNPDFKPIEFEGFKNEAGTNRFALSPQQWIEKTNAIGLISKSGRYGGTYAHKDIAFEFGAWINPSFKLYLIKEFQRLKEIEGDKSKLEWNFRRSLAATNYRIQTDAIKETLIPWGDTPQKNDVYIYAEEADLVNLALFGITSKQWKEKYPEEAFHHKNIRDSVDTNRLIVLSNLESLNAILIRKGMGKMERFDMLRETATNQLISLNKSVKDPLAIESPNQKKIK